ncbi:MAG: 23S rRNA (pseudouridine(1915)-N(3))-methyltransferase RlmH [Acidobacteria bacterium]|nr:23S rRNA (pseudouridine(1915)-N(3))-methyltransferase RlmH [Acidobacteriota bacterium]
MDIIILTVRQSGNRKGPAADLVQLYIERTSHFHPCKWLQVRSVDEVWAQREKPASHLILLDPRGEMRTSEGLAETIGKLRDSGKRTLLFAIGPADGWSAADRDRAGALLSLGKMTLPHELAAAVLSEQIYRACTILAGHPYHCGH